MSFVLVLNDKAAGYVIKLSNNLFLSLSLLIKKSLSRSLPIDVHVITAINSRNKNYYGCDLFNFDY